MVIKMIDKEKAIGSEEMKEPIKQTPLQVYLIGVVCGLLLGFVLTNLIWKLLNF